MHLNSALQCYKIHTHPITKSSAIVVGLLFWIMVWVPKKVPQVSGGFVQMTANPFALFVNKQRIRLENVVVALMAGGKRKPPSKNADDVSQLNTRERGVLFLLLLHTTIDELCESRCLPFLRAKACLLCRMYYHYEICAASFKRAKATRRAWNFLWHHH